MVVRALEDASADTRIKARKTFESLQRLWPERAAVLLGQVKEQVRKQLMQGAAAAASSSQEALSAGQDAAAAARPRQGKRTDFRAARLEFRSKNAAPAAAGAAAPLVLLAPRTGAACAASPAKASQGLPASHADSPQPEDKEKAAVAEAIRLLELENTPPVLAPVTVTVPC